MLSLVTNIFPRLFFYILHPLDEKSLSRSCVLLYTFPLRLFLDSIGFLSVVVYKVEHIFFLCWPRERKIRKS